MSAIVGGVGNEGQMATFGGADKINIDKEEPLATRSQKDFSRV